MDKLTDRQLDILFNLLVGEQNHIFNENENIQKALKGYKKELKELISIVSHSYEG